MENRDTPEGWNKFLRRALSCDFFANLDDADGFKLVKFGLSFHQEVDDKGLLSDMGANDSTPLTAQMHRDALKGTFTISWNCH